MKVVPLQVMFSQPGKSKARYEYGVPDIKTAITAIPCEDGTYVFHTHDRCGSCEPGPFYQVAFRIEDYSPYKKGDIVLSLQNRRFQASPETIQNDLFYDEAADLWYQRSKYKKTKNGNWRLIAEDKNDALTAESITTSGVFKVYSYRKQSGQMLHGMEYDMPWIYVLPSSISKENYLQMLSDLISLNEKLVRKKGSSTGIGALSSAESETDLLCSEIIKTDELAEAVRQVMTLPSELLGKKYIKTRTDKVKRFDSKTMRDYIKYGGSGKISGIEYFENHDTYENRIIKYVLRKVQEHVRNEDRPKVKSEEEIESEITARLAKIDEMRYVVGKIDELTRQKIRSEITESIKKENLQRKEALKLYESRSHLAALLSNKWFNHITDLSSISNIKPSQKFISNKYYSRIYKIITEQFADKPFINASFDINAFGVISTHYIYEYWVLLKILNKLMSLGFTFENQNELKDHFQRFTSKGELKSMKIPMLRKDEHHSVKIEVGYQIRFECSDLPPREPDYYIKVLNGDSCHWYFMDAKYKDFTAGQGSGVNYIGEVHKVAVQKYINDIGKIFNYKDSYASKEDDIRGSYIIMANIDDDTELTENDRLFCQNKIIMGLEDERIAEAKGNAFSLVNYKRPMHRYGAIKLTPDYDGELTSLLQLIFEYLETDNNKEHPNLDWCWKCNSTHIDKTAGATWGGKTKYYTTCPICGDFRVITNCDGGSHIIIKHDQGNYHCSDKTKQNKWAFVCPTCGGRL